MPIFVYYNVNRSVLDIPLRIRGSHSFEKASAFQAFAGNNFRLFFEWFRNQEDYENEIRRNDSFFEDIQLKAVRNAIYSFMPGFNNLRVERRPKLNMTIEKNNKKLIINSLSDGEKCLIAMIGDLARRMATANPQMEYPLEGEGIVLIDEVELHLHPEWQRKIVPSLCNVFPNIQFFITTHSPQVLGEIKDMDIIKLIKYNDDAKAQRIISTFGRDSDFILEQFMDASEKNTDTSKKINQIYELINIKNFNEAERIMEDIAGEVGNDDADVVKTRLLIARGKAKNEAGDKGRPAT